MMLRLGCNLLCAVVLLMTSCAPAIADDSFILHVGGWSKHWGFDTSVGVGANYGYTTCYGEDNSSKNICPDAVAGVGYKVGRVSLGIKVKPGVSIFTPEIHF